MCTVHSSSVPVGIFAWIFFAICCAVLLLLFCCSSGPVDRSPATAEARRAGGRAGGCGKVVEAAKRHHHLGSLAGVPQRAVGVFSAGDWDSNPRGSEVLKTAASQIR